jgi:hypothetical protein
VKPIKSRLHKFFTKNQHSPLDSANNRCYSTDRTKEEGQRDKKIERKSLRYPPYQPGSVLNKLVDIDYKEKGEMTYVNA